MGRPWRLNRILQKCSNGETLHNLSCTYIRVIRSFIEEDKELARAPLLQNVLNQAEVDVAFPHICAICDDGGDVIYCDGRCHRLFHPTKASGAGYSCESLGLAEAEVQDLDKYYCPNCQHDQQQCMICGELGFTAPTSKSSEVRCCDVSCCKKVFHVECLFGGMGQYFTDEINLGNTKLHCPLHNCSVCDKAELNEEDKFVQCRRCPKAWHRACLTDFSQSKELDSTTIWHADGRDFIYCRKHKIDPQLQAPQHNHLNFPVV